LVRNPARGSPFPGGWLPAVPAGEAIERQGRQHSARQRRRARRGSHTADLRAAHAAREAGRAHSAAADQSGALSRPGAAARIGAEC